MRFVMKKIICLNLIIFSWGLCVAQQASDYFTVDPGLQWQFIATPLDSINNEIDSLEYHRWDLFISEADFEGKPAGGMIVHSSANCGKSQGKLQSALQVLTSDPVGA